MAGYDASKDKLIKEYLFGEGTWRVATFSYNQGPEKIVVQMKDRLRDGTEVWKNHQGRMLRDEAVIIAHAILEACK